MSGRSPKALLPSSLSLSSIQRALPTAKNTKIKSYAVRTLATSTARHDKLSLVRQHRPPTSGASAPAGAGASAQSRSGPTNKSPRPSAAAATDSHKALLAAGATANSRTAFAGYFEPTATRSFSTSARTPHQQSVSSSSGGISSPPPPGNSPLSGSGSGGAAAPKHHSSLATPSSQPDGGDLYLSPNAYQSSHNSSLPSTINHPSTPLPSTSQSSQPPSSSSTSNPPATLFTSAPPAHFPPRALPSFFGSALSIARRSNLVFRNGAYGIPKPEMGRRNKGKEKMLMPPEGTPEEHYLSVGVGEDAYFLRSDSLGVADGVGGWSGHAGANSARWARKLMHHCSAELARYENVEDDLFLRYYEVDPVDILQCAYEKTLAECKQEGTIGSSTALLAILRNDELRLANLGDCSCCVIRGSDYIFRSEEQQHQFNFPFQAGTNAKDTPAKDAQRLTIPVKRDDIVILASDGLVDNVFSDDLLEEVLRFVSSNSPLPTPASSPPAASSGQFTLRRFSPQAVSEALCFRAKSVYDDQRAVASPFQQRAMEEGIHYAGGKIDDVSCLVGVVGELEAAPNRRDVS
ncbi:hypothetical protein JCM11641_007491 [Rhodosporidiobolus odoratus]